MLKKGNRKGFTLIELLAVIVVLGIIATIGVVGVASVIQTTKEKTYDQQVSAIIKAAKHWAIENTEELPDTGSITVSVQRLKDEGKLTEIPKNPSSSELMDGVVKISCTTNCVSYTYEYID